MFSFQSRPVMGLAALAGVAISLIPVWALAADLDRVEVTAQSVRTDVTRTCPAIGDQLASSLSSAFSRYDLEGDYRVEFSLHGGRVHDIKAMSRDNWDGRRAIRRAMRDVDCQDTASADSAQRFAFVLSVRMEDEGGGQVARFVVKPVTLVASAR